MAYYVIEETADGKAYAHRFENENKYHFFIDGWACSDSAFKAANPDEFNFVARAHGFFYNHAQGKPRKRVRV